MTVDGAGVVVEENFTCDDGVDRDSEAAQGFSHKQESSGIHRQDIE